MKAAINLGYDNFRFTLYYMLEYLLLQMQIHHYFSESRLHLVWVSSLRLTLLDVKS